ncbi:MAG: hypothetical protein JEZ10_00250 [Verrucomicrobia bacterium]|nr:hypothetical protein [Verrucomicrobiota bacterium]
MTLTRDSASRQAYDVESPSNLATLNRCFEHVPRMISGSADKVDLTRVFTTILP